MEAPLARDIPVGNGTLLVCFDQSYRIRDLYFPHVGQENHVNGQFFRFGVWVDNRLSWVSEGWNLEMRYLPDALVTDVSLQNQDLGLRLICNDAVDFHENIYLREISVENMQPRPREIRLFFTHDFNIMGNSVGDTAAFDPKSGGVVHYKESRYFLANGYAEGSEDLAQFAIGQTGTQGREGTYKDAEDGILSGNAIAQGSVDSVIGLTLNVDGMSTRKAFYWIAAGQNWDEVRSLDARVKKRKPEELIRRTADYWSLWVRKETPPLQHLPEKVKDLYFRSLLVVRTQVDWQGGILAANDSDVIQFNRDTYSCIWPRDAALVAHALDLAGYGVLAQKFYKFAADVIDPNGYFLHRYNPDGTLASSWHPWFIGDHPQLPIQEDETALVIWALWNHFVLYRDIEFIKPFFRPLIKNAADFMCRYRDEITGLPAPSYDLWEERRGILSFTTGAVFGGLTAASLFCEVFGQKDKADQYRQAAAEIRDAASKHMWRNDLNRFCRMISVNKDGGIEVDGTCDASLWGLFAFGLYTVDDPRIVSTVAALQNALLIKTRVGGMARYENDGYYRVSHDIPGNPWFVCSLWMADFLTDRAHDEKELAEAVNILVWVAERARPSGVLSEQVHPFTGEPLSASPLTWSHASFIASTQRILRRMEKINICPECGLSPMAQGRREDWLKELFAQTCDSIHGICQVK